MHRHEFITAWNGYQEGILMMTDSGRGQGRCLFFAEVETKESDHSTVQRLVALRVFKKESQKTPRGEIDLALRRLSEFKNRKPGK